MLDRFTLITAVWGEKHPALFLDIGLPSLLAPDNIPKLAELSVVSYVIYSTSSVIKELNDSPVVRRLRELVDLQLIEFEHDFANNHLAMNWCHRQGFDFAIANQSYAVFIPPDCIWSQQSMLAMYNIANRGYKLVHMSGVRLVSETFVPKIHREYPNSQVINISSRDLVKLGLDCLHHITYMHFFEEKEGFLMPANLFWTVGDEGILGRNFHYHPLLINAVGKPCDFHSTIDDDLSLEFNAADNEEYIVTDSDELIAFEMSSWEHSVLSTYNKGSYDDIVTWGSTNANIKHREYIKHPLKIHSEEMTSDLWEEKIVKSNAVVDKLLCLLEQNKQELISQQAVKPITLKNIFANILSKIRALRSIRHPLSWKYSLYKDVHKPLYTVISKLRGKVLLVDRSIPRLDTEILLPLRWDRLDIEVADDAAIANAIDYYKRGVYDCIVIRNPRFLPNSEFWNFVREALKPSGVLICTVTSQEDIEQLNRIKPAEVKLVKQIALGGIGTKITLFLHHLNCTKLPYLYSRFKSSIFFHLVVLLLIPLVVLLGPAFYIGIRFLNLLPVQAIWAEKSFTFEMS